MAVWHSGTGTEAGLPNSTTHRLLTTMQQRLCPSVGELGHWATAHAFMVGAAFQSRNLLAIVHPILRNLMEESGRTVNGGA